MNTEPEPIDYERFGAGVLIRRGRFEVVLSPSKLGEDLRYLESLDSRGYVRRGQIKLTEQDVRDALSHLGGAA